MTDASAPHHEITEEAQAFLKTYYKDDIANLALEGGSALYVEWSDLFQHAPALAEDYHEHAHLIRPALTAGLHDVDLPADIPSSAVVRVIDSEEWLDWHDPADLRAQHIGRWVGVEGQVSKVTGIKHRLETAAFECSNCGHLNTIKQRATTLQKPSVCAACEKSRNVTFITRPSDSTLTDTRKLKVETPAGRRAQGAGDSVTVFVKDDLCHFGGENGLADRAGERAVIFGQYKGLMEGASSSKKPYIRTHLVAESIHFLDRTVGDLSVDETKDEFMEYAASDDPVELLKQSIAPQLETTEQIDAVLEAGVAYLFNSYRMERGGNTKRGDLHLGIIGDPSTGKSTILSGMHQVAPKSVYRSGGSISKVGLTAAAVQEEFDGETEWVLEPGVLARANGGHCLIDEVDEVLDERSKAIHDALEGEQMVKVDKAGLSADLPTRTALCISGNPKYGRFDPMEDIAEQLDMDPAFISRIDVLLQVTDELDRDRDKRIAGKILRSYRELSEAEAAERRGEEPPDPEETARPVPIAVFRDWVHYARTNCFPTLSRSADEELAQTFLDARNLNEGYGAERDNPPIPTTTRVLDAAIRLSTAFARVELAETVERRHVLRAKKILKRSIGLNFDRETGRFDADKTSEALPRSQHDRIKSIKALIDDLNRDGNPTREDVIETAVEEHGISESKVEHELEKLSQRGEIYEPPDGGIRTT